MGDGQHEYVDVGLAELPVCTVDKQHFLPAGRQERAEELCDEVVAEVKFRKKSLDTPQTRIRLGERVETVRQRAVAHDFSLAQSGYKQTNQADVRLFIFFEKKPLTVSNI